jgi:hypothetical protein
MHTYIHTLSLSRQRAWNVGKIPKKASKSQANTYCALAEQEADCSLNKSALQRRRHHICVVRKLDFGISRSRAVSRAKRVSSKSEAVLEAGTNGYF